MIRVTLLAIALVLSLAACSNPPPAAPAPEPSPVNELPDHRKQMYLEARNVVDQGMTLLDLPVPSHKEYMTTCATLERNKWDLMEAIDAESRTMNDRTAIIGGSLTTMGNLKDKDGAAVFSGYTVAEFCVWVEAHRR